MSSWTIDILRKRDGKFRLCVLTQPCDRFETAEISSTDRRVVAPAIQKIARRLGRPEVIHTDHAQVWRGLPAVVGAAHRVYPPAVQTRLSLLERRMRAEDRS
jgi:hypothetical protein